MLIKPTLTWVIEVVAVRYGINLPNGGLTGDPCTAAELAALAEVSGWDGVFLEDYIV